MTGDARGEAERIVDEYRAATVPAPSRGAALKADADFVTAHDRLVAALAAAIEEQDAEYDDRWKVWNSVPDAEQRLHEAKLARRDALSALRARAGEET